MAESQLLWHQLTGVSYRSVDNVDQNVPRFIPIRI